MLVSREQGSNEGLAFWGFIAITSSGMNITSYTVQKFTKEPNLNQAGLRSLVFISVACYHFPFTGSPDNMWGLGSSHPPANISAADKRMISEPLLFPSVTDGSTHLLPLYWIFIILSYGCYMTATRSDSRFSVFY